MANGLFNIYDARANEQEDLEKSAMQFANLSPGRGMVAASTQAGGMFGQGARDLLGGMSPEAAKAYKIKEIMSKYANSDKNDPGIYQKMITEFTSAGLLEEAEEAASILKQIQKVSGDTSMMKNIRDIANNEIQCSFNKDDPNYDPECYKKALERLESYKRENPYVKSLNLASKTQQKAAEDIYSQGNDASQRIPSIEADIKALEGLGDSFYTGVGGDFVLGANKLAAVFGINVNSTAEAERFASTSTSRVLNYVNQTKGSISDKEMEIFTKATTGLLKTNAGNLLILHTLKESAKYLERKADFYAKWEADTYESGNIPTAFAWRKALREWEQAGNKLVVPSQADIDKATAGAKFDFTANYGSGEGATTGKTSGNVDGISWKIIEE